MGLKDRLLLHTFSAASPSVSCSGPSMCSVVSVLRYFSDEVASVPLPSTQVGMSWPLVSAGCFPRDASLFLSLQNLVFVLFLEQLKIIEPFGRIALQPPPPLHLDKLCVRLKCTTSPQGIFTKGAMNELHPPSPILFRPLYCV
ncbi:hypothetical protein DL98DRAFT_28271 [Cadophora sp. DSE1049]|nr:hypothetical protein DL98DRAFT_28271 [Cadophora sp. DSE1049]